MRKRYLPALVCSILILVASSAHAQDVSVDVNATVRGNSTTTRVETRAELQAKWEDMDARREAQRQEAEERRQDAREARVELQQDIAVRKVEHTAEVMLRVIARLEMIIERIESRIEKIDEAGGDTEASAGYIVAAEADLSEAKVAIEAFSEIDLSSEVLQENFQRIRAAAAQAREHIRSAHRNLMLAVRYLISVEVVIEGEVEAEEEDDDDDDSGE